MEPEVGVCVVEPELVVGVCVVEPERVVGRCATNDPDAIDHGKLLGHIFSPFGLCPKMAYAVLKSSVPRRISIFVASFNNHMLELPNLV